MSFSQYELSNSAGHPIKLYEFIRQTKSWLYTNADRDVSYGGRSYIAIACSDSGVTQSGDTDADTVTITVPFNADVVKQWSSTPTSDSIQLIIRRMHQNDGDFEAPVTWVGEVTGLTRPDYVSRAIQCGNMISRFARGGLRMTWERGCPHRLYDQNCRVDKTLFAVTGTVQTVSNTSCLVAAASTFPGGWFNGGYMSWEIEPGLFESVGIETHTGSQLQLFGATSWLENGQNVVLYPGCLRTIQVCHDKFNNVPNYGGFTNMPGTSPFNGNPVF